MARIFQGVKAGMLALERGTTQEIRDYGFAREYLTMIQSHLTRIKDQERT